MINVVNIQYWIFILFFFFFNDTATTEIYTLSLHDALPISHPGRPAQHHRGARCAGARLPAARSEEHTSELQSRGHLVCRLLLEKKNILTTINGIESSFTTIYFV